MENPGDHRAGAAGQADDAGAAGQAADDAGAAGTSNGGTAGSDVGGIDEATASEPVEPGPDPAPVEGPYRGFGLQGMYKVEWGQDDGFFEEDFELIHELGFNFVRLPLDYLAYTNSTDWRRFELEGLEKLDRAVEFGQKYGIHVWLNLHQPPGFCVYDENVHCPLGQDLPLWTNEEVQEVFTAHWRMLASRYSRIPAEYLSFNLVNEPHDVTERHYLEVMQPAIEAIREVTSDRPIVLDGLDYGREPLMSLLGDDSIIQSLHPYNPIHLVFYGVDWITGATDWPVPQWPPQLMPPCFFGSFWSELQSPLTIEGDFPAGTEVAIHVDEVSAYADFRVHANDTEVFSHAFEPGPGEGEWTEVIEDFGDGNYRNRYDRDYSFTLDSSATSLAFEMPEGDWLTFSAIRLTIPTEGESREVTLSPGIETWEVPQTTQTLDATGQLTVAIVPPGYEDYYSIVHQMVPYIDQWHLLRESGVEVTVGELGVASGTPHDVMLRYTDDLLEVLGDEGVGWAAWQLYGECGIFDTGREDVAYESYAGHELDRDYLTLLQSR